MIFALIMIKKDNDIFIFYGYILFKKLKNELPHIKTKTPIMGFLQSCNSSELYMKYEYWNRSINKINQEVQH